MAQIPYEIIRSSRRTLSLQITPDGRVIARAPNRMPKRQIEDFLSEKSHWILSHLEKISSRPQLPALTGEDLTALS